MAERWLQEQKPTRRTDHHGATGRSRRDHADADPLADPRKPRATANRRFAKQTTPRNNPPMKCPKCKSRTTVREKRGPFRDRACTNPECRYAFTSSEFAIPNDSRPRLCAKTRLSAISRPPLSTAIQNRR